MGKIIGIDLSSKGGCAAVLECGKPSVIAVSDDTPITESPNIILRDKKRNTIHEQDLSRREQTALYLSHIKHCAEGYLGEKISEAVISVPGYYPMVLRQFVLDAASIAGFERIRLIKDSVSVAATYHLQTRVNANVLTVVIKDGYYDLSIVQVGDGVVEVLAVKGCPEDKSKDSLLEDLISDLLADSGFGKEDIDIILMSGEQWLFSEQRNTLDRIFPGKQSIPIPRDLIATGAAYEGGVICGDEACRDFLLLDVIPYSLSIETEGGVATKLIDRNTTIPTKKSITFSTAADNQIAVDVAVYEGEEPLAKDNLRIGSMRLDNIGPVKRGEPRIEVGIDIDANGRTQIFAQNVETGFRKETQVAPMALSDSQIEASREHIKPIIDAEKEKAEREREAEERRSLENGIREMYASFESYKSNAELEKTKAVGNAVKGILDQLLPVIDNFERALEAASRDPQVVPYLQGFSMIYKQLLNNLKNAGVARIECVGRTFDPMFHEAVVHVDDPMVGEGIIVEEFQAGYMYNGQVLCFSKVKVAN